MRRTFLLAALLFAPLPLAAQGLVVERTISAGLAAEAVTAAVEACAARGHRVTAAVVDRSGVLRALLRADGAGPHTVSSARDKAYTAASMRATCCSDGSSSAIGECSSLRLTSWTRASISGSI